MLHFSKSLRLLILLVLLLPACNLATREKPTPLPGSTVKRIAFYSDAVYVVNVDGSGLARLTNVGSYKPAWSPDGQYIAFIWRDTNVYMMKADGNGSPISLSDFGNIDDPPSWSPDGQQLVFSSYTGAGDGSLYLVDIGNVLKGVKNKEPMRLNAIGIDAQDPVWSPDGRQIALFYREEYHEPFKVVVLNITTPQNPKPGDWIDLGEGTQPAWSPDSQHLVFVSWSKDDYRGLYVANLDAGGQTRLTEKTFDVTPTWSPDGKHIAFVSNRDDNYEIYVMNADGSQQTRLTNDPAEDTSPAWSPDSEQIAFVSKRDGNQEIYVMNADGSDQRRLTNTPEDEQGPVWAPLPPYPSIVTPQASQVTLGNNLVLAVIILVVTALLAGLLLVVLISEMRRKQSNKF